MNFTIGNYWELSYFYADEISAKVLEIKPKINLR